MRPTCGVFSTLIPGHCRCQSGRGGSASALTLGLGLRLWPARGVHHARGLLLLNAAGACAWLWLWLNAPAKNAPARRVVIVPTRIGATSWEWVCDLTSIAGDRLSNDMESSC